MKYVYVIETAADVSFSAFVPDLPGCTTSGDTVGEVKACINEAVAAHIGSLLVHNELVPPPSSQSTLSRWRDAK